jgi:hypothetical protein
MVSQTLSRYATCSRYAILLARFSAHVNLETPCRNLNYSPRSKQKSIDTTSGHFVDKPPSIAEGGQGVVVPGTGLLDSDHTGGMLSWARNMRTSKGTTKIGFVNRNGQVVIRNTGLPLKSTSSSGVYSHMQRSGERRSYCAQTVPKLRTIGCKVAQPESLISLCFVTFGCLLLYRV